LTYHPSPPLSLPVSPLFPLPGKLDSELALSLKQEMQDILLASEIMAIVETPIEAATTVATAQGK